MRLLGLARKTFITSTIKIPVEVSLTMNIDFLTLIVNPSKPVSLPMAFLIICIAELMFSEKASSFEG